MKLTEKIVDETPRQICELNDPVFFIFEESLYLKTDDLIYNISNGGYATELSPFSPIKKIEIEEIIFSMK